MSVLLSHKVIGGGKWDGNTALPGCCGWNGSSVGRHGWDRSETGQGQVIGNEVYMDG